MDVIKATQVIEVTTEHEDTERMPDGVPHNIVGLTLLFSVILALLVAVMVLSGGSVGKLAGFVICLIAIPALVTSLSGKSERERDHSHPSR